MGGERQTNMHSYVQTITHTTLFKKPFQETRHVPTAGCGRVPGFNKKKKTKKMSGFLKAHIYLRDGLHILLQIW